MRQDIDSALQGWEFKPGVVQARMVQAGDGRQVIQLRVDLGLLQIEITGRPDGNRPHGFPTFFAYLRHQSALAERTGQQFVLSEEQCMEADREFIQFYHRRMCWLALRNYSQAVADSDHTLAFMDFVRDHSPGEEYTRAHEQYRGFVVFQRTQAAAAHFVEKEEPLRNFFSAHDLEEQFDENPMVQQLRKLEQSLRKTHGIEATLLEQLQKAVANEEYEAAARIRDVLRRRGK